MKIILIGSDGRMGREIQNLVNEEKIDKIVALVDENKPLPKKNVKADCIIDFSSAKDRTNYFEYSKKYQIPYACFSTNLSEQDEKGLLDLKYFVPTLKCQNASDGVKLLYDLTQSCAKTLKNSQALITEVHHKNKKDSPSGTAKQLENILKENNIPFTTTCHRVGTEKGYHKIEFYLDDELITISHRAFSRKIFAKGALEKAHTLITQ